MLDIHGNVVEKGDNIYILDSVIAGPKNRRLLYGEVTKVTHSKCEVLVYENQKTYKKTSATVLLPKE